MIWFICEANTQMQSISKKIIICEILVLFLLYPNYNACTQLVLLFCIFCTDYKYLLPSNGNPYHNNIHAADVLQTTHWMISQTGLKVSNNKLSLSQQQQHRIGSLILRSLPCSSLPSSMTLITQAPQTTSTSSQTPTRLSFTMIGQFWRTIMWQLFSGKILLLCTSGVSGSWLKRNYMFKDHEWRRILCFGTMIDNEYYVSGSWLTMNAIFWTTCPSRSSESSDPWWLKWFFTQVCITWHLTPLLTIISDIFRHVHALHSAEVDEGVDTNCNNRWQVWCMNYFSTRKNRQKILKSLAKLVWTA